MRHTPVARRALATPRSLRPAGAAVAAVLMLAACGGTTDTAGTDPTSTDPTTTQRTDAAGDTTGTDSSGTGSSGTGSDGADDAVESGSLDDVVWEVRELASGLDGPVEVVGSPVDDRLLVVEQVGRVQALGGDTAPLEPVADLTDRVRSGGEQGLLGLAFSPTFAEDGRAFVHYSGRPDGRTVLSEFRVDPSTLDFDTGSEQVLLEADQPAGNHNGGSVVFGPDGRLHLALGDGGAADDRFGNGQRPDTLLGTMLRLDVDEPGRAVAAAGNPYADGDGGAPEVLHHGLRNPYRITFHEGALLIADVGQDAVEEVDLVDAAATGLNFGWPVFEGDACFDGPCEDGAPGFEMPAVTYRHDDTGGCSIIGGAVYDGPVEVLRDHYVYGDFCTGLVRSFRVDGTSAVDERDWTQVLGPLQQVTSFSGVEGEVYATFADGRVLHLVPSAG